MHRIEFIRGLKALKPEHRGSVATIGAFDGVHLGHQKLLSQLKERSVQLGLPTVVTIFEPQPNEYFHRDEAPARLMRLREKVAALESCKIDRVLCLKFNQGLRGLSADRFVKQILVDGLGARFIVVGDDFRFGCDRRGDFSYLKDAGAKYDFDVQDMDTHHVQAERVSSTRIRKLLHNAQLNDAQYLLGKAYTNLGRVKYGRQLGRKIGFPTVNIDLGRKQVPIAGVFAVEVTHNIKCYRGVANVGVRPTVDGADRPVLEVHLLDTDANLYGEFLQVRYLYKLREEKKFESLDDLQTQITRDIVVAREYFSTN